MTVAPANTSASVCAASLFASVLGVLTLVFMAFPLVSFCGGVVFWFLVYHAYPACVYMCGRCGVGVARHVGGEYRLVRVR